jgi:hypothetical protein
VVTPNSLAGNLPHALDHARLLNLLVARDQRRTVSAGCGDDHPVVHLWNTGQCDQRAGAIQIEREYLEIVGLGDPIQRLDHVDVVPAAFDGVDDLGKDDGRDQKNGVACADVFEGGLGVGAKAGHVVEVPQEAIAYR